MRTYLIVFLGALGVWACGIKKQIEKGIDLGFRAVLIPRIATTRFLAESVQSIYELNTRVPDSALFIHSLNAHFYDHAHSFDLVLDSITVRAIRDTIVFSEINFPKSNVYLQSDTIAVRVTCNYFLRNSLADTAEKCLFGNYIIYRDSIVQKDKFTPCTF